MKVYDILVESDKKVDEGPIRFLKRTLGKNTAMGKAAQLDVEIDREVKSLFKDFFAVSKQDPQKKGMTIGNLANFLKAKGFVSDANSVMKYFNDNPTLSKRVSKAAGAAVDATTGAAKKGAAAVSKAASAIKNKVKPEPSGMTPDPRQGELDLKQSIYGEALEAYQLALEAEKVDANTPLDKKEVMIVMKKFVQQGFQKQLGGRIGKSAYGDAGKGGGGAAKAQPAMDKTTADAIAHIKSKGGTVNFDKEKTPA